MKTGTSIIKDLNPGVNASNPSYLTYCNGKVLFGAQDGVHGNELWIYHLTLAYAILDSAPLLALVTGLWFLYSLKCMQFVLKSLGEPNNSFLHVLAGLSPFEIYETGD